MQRFGLGMAGMLLLVALAPRPAGAATSVRVEVATAWRPESLRLELHGQWLGEDRRLVLLDDGRSPDERAGDGVYSGQWEGEEVRALSLRLLAMVGQDEPVVLWSGTESLPMGQRRLTFAVDEGAAGPVARRSAVALPLPSMEVAEATSVAALLGWIGLVLLYLLGVVARVVKGRRS